MADLNRLPGVIVRINDGGLKVSPPVNDSPRTLIIGTAVKGPAYTPIEVTSQGAMQKLFGTVGSLFTKMSEVVVGGGENITLFRVGSTPSYITGIGGVSGDPNNLGITLTFENHSPTIDDDYYIAYQTGVLKVYTARGTLLYSDDPADPIDLNQVTTSGTATVGTTILVDPTGSVVFANSVKVGDLGTSYGITTFVSGGSGLNPSKRRLYEIAHTAFALLDGYDSDTVIIADATVDCPNVAYFETTNANQAEHDPRGDTDVLAWFRAVADNTTFELYQYYWSEAISGDPAAPASYSDSDLDTLKDAAPTGYVSQITFVDAEDRIAKDFHEVSFGYLLANYCYQMTKNNNEMIGVMAIRGPATSKLYDLNIWVGQSPTYDDDGTVIDDGSGLLGFPMTMGCSNSRLNNLVLGQSTGRIPGYFATDTEYIDGTVVKDDNNYKVDIGAYLNIVGEYPTILGSNYPYVGPIDGVYAGRIASLDVKSAPTFKSLGPYIRQRYKLSKAKHDEIVQAKIVMMDVVPIKGYAIVDAMTAATDISDFRRLTTVRILHKVSQHMRKATIPFIGEAALTGPKRAAMSAAIENEYALLAKRGYLSNYTFRIEISKYDQVMGNVYVYHSFIPALETRRVTHTYQFTI